MVKYVLLGELILFETGDDSKQFKVIERIVHPKYHIDSKDHNIALLKIEGPVSFSDHIRPLCLSDIDTAEYSWPALITGWCRNIRDKSKKTLLQKVPFELVTNEDCTAVYQPSRKIDYETQLCAGRTDERKDACQVFGI